MANERVQIVTGRCRGCGACVTQCRECAITLFTDADNRKLIRIDTAKCTGCGKCIPICRYGAVRQS
ncbi:4Fe-4S binding protein [Seleniivibrio woodruffii]|uniref:4Fe-4S binding protein n=1 Tax=Seleniivibrio woodruffii TaxID=1078050 RepID=UPI0026E982E3|nr:4Fe-4S binding protein [Seleniivibrio woodruffii]